MITLKDCKFNAAGSGKKDTVYGLTLNGAEDVRIQDCIFSNTGYAAILNHCEGDVLVKSCTFECGNVYNPIEGSQKVKNGNLTVADCEFAGDLGNNFVNFYNNKDNARVNIVRSKFSGTTSNNIIRISNLANSTLVFDIEDCEYSYTSGEVSEYTGFVLCQDFTAKSGSKQDFSKCHINVKNLTKPENYTRYFYVYEDGRGVITDNNPDVTVDGDSVA